MRRVIPIVLVVLLAMVVPPLRAAGASGILVLPIEKLVP